MLWLSSVFQKSVFSTHYPSLIDWFDSLEARVASQLEVNVLQEYRSATTLMVRCSRVTKRRRPLRRRAQIGLSSYVWPATDGQRPIACVDNWRQLQSVENRRTRQKNKQKKNTRVITRANGADRAHLGTRSALTTRSFTFWNDRSLHETKAALNGTLARL